MSDHQTLRDTFAAAAMTGMMAHGHWPTHDGGAEDAWKAADAMLRARGDTPCTTLTGAEREALWSAIEHGEDATVSGLPPLWTSALRQLLDRLGGAS